MDDLDRARHYQDMLNLEATSKRKPTPALDYTAECHNCGEAVASPKRFCDSDCADEWEEIERRARA